MTPAHSRWKSAFSPRSPCPSVCECFPVAAIRSPSRIEGQSGIFRDEHDRWFILQPSAKDSKKAFVRWVYLPEDRPERLARSALRRWTVVGYDYVRRSAAPNPVRSTVTAMLVTERWPETTYECGSCEALFDTARDHALHCWDAHPWVPNPEQVRRRRQADE